MNIILTTAVAGAMLLACSIALGCSEPDPTPTPEPTNARNVEAVGETEHAGGGETLSELKEGEFEELVGAMDAGTRALFQDLSPEWQEMTIQLVATIRADAPDEDIGNLTRSLVSSSYDNAKEQDELRPQAALDDDPRWCRVDASSGKRETLGRVIALDVLDDDAKVLFGDLSPTGMEVAGQVFRSISASVPCAHWRRLTQKYVLYLHTAERGGWTEESAVSPQ